MPTRVEDGTGRLSASFAELFPDDVLSARAAFINQCGFDPLMSPRFWEHWLAVLLGAETTPIQCEHDLVITSPWRRYTFEVKFSRAFDMAFTTGKRSVFRWVMTRPQMARAKKPDVALLIGVSDGRVWCWACDPNEAGRATTITVPRDDFKTDWRVKPQMLPVCDLLPGVLNFLANNAA